jgi:hypothetical protein
MWTQIVGKTKLRACPKSNQWWHVALYVTSRGLTTLAMPFGTSTFEVEFDFVKHRLVVTTSTGAEREIALYPRSVASFYDEYMQVLRSLGIEIRIYTTPSEVADPIPFDKDQVHASYDREYVTRFWRVLVQANRVLNQYRGGFTGKSSPVHFFWGSFDLAVSRFNGRAAPVPDGADPITREAYNEEVISCGFWPGDARFDRAAFYAYIVPAPAGLEKERVKPSDAFFSDTLREFLLPYDAVCNSESPDRAILDFCSSSYEAAARLAGWDRRSLERIAA